jgi:hypothetical protein
MGNPWKRTSLSFRVVFEDGDILPLPYGPDLASTKQLEDFVTATPSLWPLRFRTAEEAHKERAVVNRGTIQGFDIGQVVYLDLRVFDGLDSAWYDSHNLPPGKRYVALVKIVRRLKADKALIVFAPALSIETTINTLDAIMYLSLSIPPNAVVVDKSWKSIYPSLFKF